MTTDSTPEDGPIVNLPRTAVGMARAVQSGSVHPLALTQAALDRITTQAHLGAVQERFDDEALAAAADLASRADLSALPLAGVPILVKDNVAVAGVPMRDGSHATSTVPSSSDHEVVRRLRAAGAIVVGVTRVPELCVWGSTDSAFGTTRNPWDLSRTPGGSSGGSAAMVAAGVVPVAHGNDGMGSIRIPAANTGLVGIKPGRGVVPAGVGTDSWGGMAENGPLATTVSDAALMLSILADVPSLQEVTEPLGPLRIAVAVNTPSFLVRLHPLWRAGTERAAQVLRDAGHEVTAVSYPYPQNPVPVFARWFEGTARDAAGLDQAQLESRTRWHVRLGRLSARLGWVKPRDDDAFTASARGFFANFDVLLTPALAQFAPTAAQWHRRSWLRNFWSNLQYAPYAALWNMLGWPAASVPAGVSREIGLPTAVQLVAPPGGERLILSVAAQIERLQPWQQLAPQPHIPPGV